MVGTAENSMRVAAVAAPMRAQVAERIRDAIFAFRFKPGDRLIERELCEMTGVSRTLLREALRQLEAEGLITLIPNRGPIVTKLTAREAAELYDVRALLEGRAGALAARHRTPAAVKRLWTCLKRLASALERRDPERLIAIKGEFYDALMASAGNATLAALLRSLQGRVSLLRATTMLAPDRSAQSLAELEAIVAAVEAGDAEAAERACACHVENAGRLAVAILREEETLP